MLIATKDGPLEVISRQPRKASRIAVTQLPPANPTLTHIGSGMALAAVLNFANGFRPKSTATLLVIARAIERETADHAGWTVLSAIPFGHGLPDDPQLKALARDWAQAARDAGFRAACGTPEYRAWRKGWITLGL